MLIPKEKPYLKRLNSYYLHIERLLEHLQGEIGSGCLYLQAADQEILVYFDEHNIVNCVTQNTGEHAQVSRDVKSVMQSLTQKCFLSSVYHYAPRALFFWSEIPTFQRATSPLKSSEILLQDLVLRFTHKKFSGFVEVNLQNHDESAILFYHLGERVMASYSWLEKGGTSSENDYNRLLGSVIANSATFNIAHYVSNLDVSLKEFMEGFIKVVGKKNKTGWLVHLKEKFLEHIDSYPTLDPFRKFYEIKDDGTVEFSGNAPKDKIAAGIVDCAWKVVEDYKVQKKFRAKVNTFEARAAFDELGIDVYR